MPLLRTYLEVALWFFALCGLGYYLLSLWSALSFRRSTLRFEQKNQQFNPPVSILKPLKGADREIYSSFRSHCLQEYGEYEIIFGVSDENDDAVPLVRRLMAEFPQQQIRLVVCPDVLGTNRKVSNLIQMLSYARYDIVVVNDSDIKVPPKYLKRVIAHFADRNVGMVTAPYRGIPAPTLGSRLEGLGISTDFIPGVLTARKIEGGLHFALGSTLAMRRKAIEKIGGFESIVDYLADDFELGLRISAAGYKVMLSSEVVETFLPAYSFKAFWEHQMRWARSTRDSRKTGYAGLMLTFGLPWALLAMLFAKGAWPSVAALGVVLLARVALAFYVGGVVLGDRSVLRNLWLLPLRDSIALLVWIGSFADDTIVWRGDRFLLRNGKIYPASAVLSEASYAVSHETEESLT